jgi:hypothetical protein
MLTRGATKWPLRRAVKGARLRAIGWHLLRQAVCIGCMGTRARKRGVLCHPAPRSCRTARLPSATDEADAAMIRNDHGWGTIISAEGH